LARLSLAAPGREEGRGRGQHVEPREPESRGAQKRPPQGAQPLGATRSARHVKTWGTWLAVPTPRCTPTPRPALRPARSRRQVTPLEAPSLCRRTHRATSRTWEAQPGASPRVPTPRLAICPTALRRGRIPRVIPAPSRPVPSRPAGALTCTTQ
jgi:hypothetical protein